MELQTALIACGIAIALIALLFASNWAKKYFGEKRWQQAVNYAELVVNAIDQLYKNDSIAKDERLEAALDRLLAAFPNIKAEDASTMIHGWLGMINKEKEQTFSLPPSDSLIQGINPPK